MDKRDKALIKYAVIMTIHDDARRMADTLRGQFTPEERQEIKDLTNQYAEMAITPGQEESFHTLRSVNYE